MASRLRSPRLWKQVGTVSLGAVGGAVLILNLRPRRPLETYHNVPSFLTHPPKFPKVPSRSEQIEKLRRSSAANEDDKNNSKEDIYDLLIVGGGATGTGIALDATTRGLKVALVERDDFSSGTSSKSTKLVHGGVRYLEKAVKELDYEQYKLVCSALKERRYFLDIAPHLSQALPLLLPIRKWWEAPYMWAGTKLYDLLAGSEGLHSSYFLTRKKALEAFPTLDGNKIVAGFVYYDGQHNDSRMNVSLAMTAAAYGATIVNHAEVTELQKDDKGKLCGAKVRDTLTNDEFVVRARGIVNATGPFADELQQKDKGEQSQMIMPSSGVHIVLPEWTGPSNYGLVDPSSDGRVLFLLPWEGRMVAGTTDHACQIQREPVPNEEDVDWILKELNRVLTPRIKIQPSHVLASWSGIRPLVRDPEAKNTEALTRSHLVSISDSGLLTCIGGKWTTYREMAEDAVDTAIKVFKLKTQPTALPADISGMARTSAADVILDGSCVTNKLRLIGAHGYSPKLVDDLMQKFQLSSDVANHLAHSYGDRAWDVASLSSPASEQDHRIAGQSFPYLDGEVRYSIRNEYAQTAPDILARRMRLSFLDVRSALQALPKVIAIMSEELGWDEGKRRDEYASTLIFLQSMGLKEYDVKDV